MWVRSVTESGEEGEEWTGGLPGAGRAASAATEGSRGRPVQYAHGEEHPNPVVLDR